MARLHVVAELQDGSSIEASGTWMTLADRIAFERRFGVSAAALARGVDDDGKVDPEVFREEQHAFAAWCLLRREGATQLPFEEFGEQADDLTITKADSSPDPTELLPPPPS